MDMLWYCRTNGDSTAPLAAIEYNK